MLSELKEKNRELKEKLGKLRNETRKVCSEAQQFIPSKSLTTSSTGSNFSPNSTCTSESFRSGLVVIYFTCSINNCTNKNHSIRYIMQFKLIVKIYSFS